jgi:predicted PurR-regulated permease PerM
MAFRTRTVVAAAVGMLALLSGVVLIELFGTVLFAITVAFVLAPVQERFLARGWDRRRASIATAVLAVGAVLAVLTPLAVVAFERRAEVAAVVGSLPETITLAALGVEFTITRAEVVEAIAAYLPPLVIDLAVFLSAASIKLALFGILVFGLLQGHERAREAILAPVPPTYVRFVEALETRARETLVSILVLQVGTSAGAFLIALPFFWILGYDYVLVLATIAGVLQFLPIIGPIVLVLGVVGVEAMAGDLAAAAIMLVGGGIVLGWLPDVLVRPRLARYTSGLSGSLYFIGFIGGLTSLGMIGIVAGPLVVALLVEGVHQLAAEMPHTDAEPATASVD